MPQPLQFKESVVVSAQPPEQQVLDPIGHTFPQIPQLLESVCLLTHPFENAGPQAVSPGLQVPIPQTPPEHV